MRRLTKRLVISLALMCVMLLGTAVPAMAYTLPNTSTPASLTITMKINGECVSGGKITLYKTGEIDTRARSYIFVPTEAFKDSGIPINDVESRTVAIQLAEYAKENSIAGISKSIGTSGTVRFNNLTVGLYMVTQDIAAEGYEAVAPFQVAVPELGQDGFVYDLEAFPKIEIISWESGDVTTEEEYEGHDENPPGTPENPDDEDGKIGDGKIDDQNDGKLPQTGQLKWPVPVLAFFGMVMFALGWYIRNTERKGNYEK